MRILLVDDEPLSRKATAQFLEEELGHDITECEHGLEAKDVLRDNKFPLVISDLRMPHMDGLELLKHVKQVSANTDFVVITGHGDLDTAIKALRLGAYDFIRKPIDVEELAASISRSMERQALINENYELKQKQTKTNVLPLDAFIRNVQLPQNGFNLYEMEATIIGKVLEMHDNNKNKAAQYLGISPQALRSRLKYI
ncbi:response regulator [Candidatus Uabimicrobium amorphum]|uniref:Sigma-54-dependent Fis family transcriptional regulator n=1 Tax=Uabimicrobium amorphum TaxID=2596890 RepID=A0A5S9IR65_UABAM|nr:response regulator [Candidatus Uabimicrobium amorphum]BBM85185.1 sigma-54-dependent Fis family transcriptional regulator [Candidatus Uabimicrobium amorphum]